MPDLSRWPKPISVIFSYCLQAALARGSFSFSFGPEAQAPSVIKAAEALVLDSISAGPNTRFVRPPRTNIILNQDQPSYDPPFTIKLEDGQAAQSLDSSAEPR